MRFFVAAVAARPIVTVTYLAWASHSTAAAVTLGYATATVYELYSTHNTEKVEICLHCNASAIYARKRTNMDSVGFRCFFIHPGATDGKHTHTGMLGTMLNSPLIRSIWLTSIKKWLCVYSKYIRIKIIFWVYQNFKIQRKVFLFFFLSKNIIYTENVNRGLLVWMWGGPHHRWWPNKNGVINGLINKPRGVCDALYKKANTYI